MRVERGPEFLESVSSRLVTGSKPAKVTAETHLLAKQDSPEQLCEFDSTVRPAPIPST